jgi:hypothetical protein
MRSTPARIALAFLLMKIFASGIILGAEPAITITDAAGETTALKSAKFTFGTRRLAWKAEKSGATDDQKLGPLVLEFREINSTTFAEGILTLVPASSVASLKYDAEKNTVALTVAGIMEPLIGPTQYKVINQIGIDAEVDKGTAGLAIVKYRGGIAKTGIKAATFSNAKPWEWPAVELKQFTVTIADAKAKNPTQTVGGLQPLYRFADGTEKLLPTLYFEKTLKVPFVEIKSWKQEPPAEKGKMPEYTIIASDGKPQTLLPIKAVEIDGKKATLLGLVGVVPAGYKLYPLHTIQELKAE